MNRTVVLLASLSLALFACRGDDGSSHADDVGDDDDMGSDGGHVIAGEVTIKQVQDDAMASGTQIELKGVVVTAIDTYGAKTGDIWVEDADGGAFSGVKVFGAPLDAVTQLAVGDTVDITNAQKNEFACTTAICGFDFDAGMSITEVESVNGGDLSIVKTGTGAVPTPPTVDGLAISMMTPEQQETEWEKWEGVYIKVVNVRQFNAVKTFGGGADDQKSFGITGIVNVESVLAPFSADAVVDVCFSGITGIGDYFGDYLVLPTTQAATSGGGSGCAALPVYAPATISEVQAGTKTGTVQISDVYVAAVSSNKKNYWLSTTLTAAPNEGLLIFGTTAVGNDVVPGAKVTVKGTTKEFDDVTPVVTGLTELTSPTVTVTAAPSGTVAPVTGQTYASLTTAGTGEPYESVLVTLTNLKVVTATNNQLTPDFGVASVAGFPGNVAFKADDDIFLLNAATAGNCYASISGIWSYSPYNNAYQFLPTAAGTLGGTCN